MVYAVTGYKGLIGSEMCSYLERLGHEVIRVDCDIRDDDIKHFISGVDGVFHFAANMGGVGYNTNNQFNPPLDNIVMDTNIIRFCTDNKIKFLYPSSACVYPQYAMNNPLKEDLLDLDADPDKMYGLEKYFITKLLRNNEFARVCILHTVYGYQEYKEEKAKFPIQVCYKFAKHDKVEVWGDGTQIRTFLHVSDAVSMMYEVFISDYYGEVNISGFEDVSVKEVVDLLSKESGKSATYLKDKPTGPIKRTVDLTKYLTHYKTRQKIGWREGFLSLYRGFL